MGMAKCPPSRRSPRRAGAVEECHSRGQPPGDGVSPARRGRNVSCVSHTGDAAARCPGPSGLLVVSARVCPIKEAEGRVVRCFGTNTDISELKQTEERLALQAEELRQSR